MDVRFSNRPFRVKRFQTIHDSGVNVARGLALLSGLGTKALPSWVSKTRWNNLSGDLAVNVTAGSSGRTNSPHPSSREGHHSTRSVELECPSIGLDAAGFSCCCCCGLFSGQAALGAVIPLAVHDISSPASQHHERIFTHASTGANLHPAVTTGAFTRL